MATLTTGRYIPRPRWGGVSAMARPAAAGFSTAAAVVVAATVVSGLGVPRTPVVWVMGLGALRTRVVWVMATRRDRCRIERRPDPRRHRGRAHRRLRCRPLLRHRSLRLRVTALPRLVIVPRRRGRALCGRARSGGGRRAVVGGGRATRALAPE